jgi:DNA-directed RNA polymerase subunit F
MIKNSKPLSMTEAVEYLKKDEEGKALKSFIKKFVVLKQEDAKKLKEKLEKLDLMQMKEEHIVNIIDLMPENEEDLNKILVGVNLNEDETKRVLETIKEFK